MEKSEMKKMKYEKPVVLDLGEMARGEGFCGSGTSAVDQCGSGTSATGVCSPTGVTPSAGNCFGGTNP